MSRSWVGTYPLCELNYAAQKGYTFEFYEIYQYSEQRPILQDFMTVLFHRRILLAGFPADVVTIQEKKQYCDRINHEMKLKGPFLVTPDKIKNDKNKYMLYKNFMNEFVGKFGQKVYRSKTVFVSNHEQIRKIFFSEDEELEFIEAINQMYCELTVISLKKTHLPSRNTNCVIAAYVTGYSRILIDLKMQEIVSTGGCIYYISTDSICYTLPRTMETPLCYGPCVHDFKQEFGTLQILSFYSVGPKETCITYAATNTMSKSAVKVKGLALQNVENLNLIDPKLLDFFLQQFLSSKYEFVAIPQIRQQRNKPLSSKQMIFMKFTNRTGCRRVLLDLGTKHFTTLPLGFTNTMLKLYKT